MVIWVNDAFELITGYKQTQVKGKRLSAILSGSSTDNQDFSDYDDLILKPDPFSLELLIYPKKGEAIWTQINSSTVLGHNGQLAQTVQIIQEVSARKAQETLLKQSEERYRKLVEDSKAIICTHDLEGKILSINRTGAESLGFEPEDMIDHKISKFLEPKF